MKKHFALLTIIFISINFTYSQQQVNLDCKKTCIIENVIYKEAFLGVRINSTVRKKGAKILKIFNNTTAENSILQINDIVTFVNGVEIVNNQQLTNMIQGMQPFDKVKVVYERGKKTKKVSLVLGAKKIFVEKNEVCCDSMDNSIFIDQVSLFPNPATTEINLTFKDALPEDLFSFEIFSMEGVKHISEKDQKLNKDISKLIKIETLADGTYVIRIVKGNESYSKQFIVAN